MPSPRRHRSCVYLAVHLLAACSPSSPPQPRQPDPHQSDDWHRGALGEPTERADPELTDAHDSARSASAADGKGCTNEAPHDETGVSFTQVLAEPIFDVAAGKAPRVAVVTKEGTLLFDGSEWRKTDGPDPLREQSRVQLFFGRDNQPRRMGYVTESPGVLRARYERYRQGRWGPGGDELGPLASRSPGLYGVLGYDDPEVVCSPKRFCLVKRLSGWARAPAHDAPVPIVASGGTAFALHPGLIEELRDGRWTPLEPPREWHAPQALWASADRDVWAVDDGAVFRRAGDRWERPEIPLTKPRAVWGTAPNDVWFVGDDGAAHFDGQRFSCVPGPRGRLAHIRYDGENLWLAGDAGLWRGVTGRPPRRGRLRSPASRRSARRR